jgi:type I restriction enzyme M protein
MSESQSSNLESSLWNAADVLRGKMDASEYKNYLLGLIFYRFLSLQSLQAFAENTGIADQDAQTIENAYHEYLAKDDDTAQFLQQALIGKVGYYIAPEYLYSSLVHEIQTGDFAIEHLEAALHALEISTNGQTSHHDFEGLFDDVDLHSNKLGGNLRQRNQVISDTMMALNDIDLWGHNGDLLGDAYE